MSWAKPISWLVLLCALQANLCSGQKCASADDESCLVSKCCTDKSKKCYEKQPPGKEGEWAGCKDSCTPGVNPYDPPEYQSPWTCNVLTPGGSSPPSRRRKGERRRKQTPSRRRGGKGGGRRRKKESRRRGSRRRKESRRRRTGGGDEGGPPPPPPPPPPGSGESSGKTIKGHLTMWANNDALIGSQCEYANAPVNSITDPMLPEYLRSGFHCAIGDSNPGFGKGEHCGKCYRLISLSDSGTGGTPGKIGPPTTVMVSNGGAGGPEHFDCIMESFQQITGANTGIFDITFEEVTCDDIKGGIVPINWADKNAYYCKMMFENVGGWGSLAEVSMSIDGGAFGKLSLFAGATWTGCPGGEGKSETTWKFKQNSGKDGSPKEVECVCPGPWPWDTGYRCNCGDTNF